MITGNTIRKEQANLNLIFSNIKRGIDFLNETAWQGNSKEAFVQKCDEILESYSSVIPQQLSDLGRAVDLLQEYEETKKSYEFYKNQCEIFKEESSMSLFNMEMLKAQKRMEELKIEINSILAGITKINDGEASQQATADLANTVSSTDSYQEKILSSAKEIHEYMEDKGYTYCVFGGNSQEECKNGGHGLNKTFEESKNGFHHTCCATYVSWVLQDAGLLAENEHQDGADNLTNLLLKKGWTKVNANDVQPGDVQSRSHHVQIVGEDGNIYNAGTGSRIRGKVSKTSGATQKGDIYLRAPSK